MTKPRYRRKLAFGLSPKRCRSLSIRIDIVTKAITTNPQLNTVLDATSRAVRWSNSEPIAQTMTEESRSTASLIGSSVSPICMETPAPTYELCSVEIAALNPRNTTNMPTAVLDKGANLLKGPNPLRL